MKDSLKQTIIMKVLSIDIKSISIYKDNKNTVHDYRTINKINFDLDDISISSKYVVQLVQSGFNIDDVVLLLKEKPEFYFITKQNKFFSCTLSNHAVIQFLKRFSYIYIINDKFEFGKHYEEIYKDYFNKVNDILINKDWKDVKSNPVVLDLLYVVMKDIEYHNITSTGRPRDLRAFKERETQHKSTNRYFSHPFLFIVEDNVMRTVELYSSSLDCRHINKESNKRDFIYTLTKLLGRD